MRIFLNRHPPNEQSDLADATMHQVDTSPENVDLEEEVEHMCAWVNSLTI